MATTNMTAQQLKLDQVRQQLDLFEKYLTIPSGYSFLRVTEQEVDKISEKWLHDGWLIENNKTL